jgi:hypothetical protein
LPVSAYLSAAMETIVFMISGISGLTYLHIEDDNMGDCEKISGCPFFNDRLKNMPETAMKMKKMYCHGSKNLCARYKVAMALGSERVPDHLYPDMMDTAEFILDENK